MPNAPSERRTGRDDPSAMLAATGGRAPRRSTRRVTGLAAGAVAAILLVAGLAGGALGPSASVAAPSPGPAGSGGTPASAGPPSLVPSLTPSPTPVPTPTPRPTTAGGVDVELATALQARLERLVGRLEVPGASVAIVWDDGRTWTGAAGTANLATDSAMTPDNGFALASVSKTFTAAVVLQLVEEGRLGLDQPVAPLVPAFRLDKRITVRMLLDHTSGLPDYFLNPKIDKALQASPDATWTPARAWTYVAAKRPVPGSRWVYANSNYLLLGELVRGVTGRPLAVEVRDRLLDPLGLANTWYQAAESPRATLTTGYRLVAQADGSLRPVQVAPVEGVMPFRSVVTAAGGAGSIASTALDTARWMRAFAGGRVLGPQMTQAMLGDTAVTSGLHARIPYGLGIQVTELAGRTAIGHSGRFLGFRSVVRYLPDDGITIAVLTNQSVVDPARIASSMLNPLLPPLPAPSPTASPSDAPAPGASATP
jgi:CubicO group peptidase (beta-lactamase class C family)